MTIHVMWMVRSMCRLLLRSGDLFHSGEGRRPSIRAKSCRPEGRKSNAFRCADSPSKTAVVQLDSPLLSLACLLSIADARLVHEPTPRTHAGPIWTSMKGGKLHPHPRQPEVGLSIISSKVPPRTPCCKTIVHVCSRCPHGTRNSTGHNDIGMPPMGLVVPAFACDCGSTDPGVLQSLSLT